MISFEEFAGLDLRVAKIIKAERIEGSGKLLKLEVDLGGERRQIIAGIGRAYQPEDLVDRQIVIVANLEPRKLMGLESQGMLLAAQAEDGAPILLMPERAAPLGSKIG